ncbi:DDE transposase [Geomonas silvestris]|uniref:DDE transposase n=1 Tax=Geomonas silvestris TaxID=2740184 RepID=A0A6V8MQ05_9BACT|nr:IS1595 family transposase [Geomonas silvestris]GFO62081.1 DDE transposase [Geomonas silvestris]
MKMNRLQFQQGLSLKSFLAQYGNEDQCEAAIESARWPTGFICPKCKGTRHCSYKRGRVKVFQCTACRKQTTLTEDTIFHSTKLPFTTWFQAMYFLTQNKNNMSSLELMRLLGVTYRAAWRIKHKLMQVMFEREQSTKLHGRVEIDDSYLGGEYQGKRGRGSENKVPFIAAVQTNKQNNPVYALFSPVQSFGHSDVRTWASQRLAPSTTVVSDGFWCFTAVTQIGCPHERHVVRKGTMKTQKMECFKWVNTILGNVKNAIIGTYHAFDFSKYPHRYLGEYQYRFNRRFDLAAMLPRLIAATVCTGRRPEAWLRTAEDWR